ncbi:HET-domain-containing protein [Hypomontagnella monticulosa]|nr:HET-domain-containing protein [Hypomontagnella monticulosa]
MDSCATCRNLEPFPGLSAGFIMGGTGQDLINSAPNCQLCSILLEGLEAFYLDSPSAVQWMALRQEEDSFRLQYKSSSSDKKWIGLHFYTKDLQDELSHIFKPSTDIEPDTSNTTYLSQMKGWVNSCDENHEICRNRLNNYLPTRVLDVSRDPDSLFLFEPEETDKGPYTALSHCWGGVVPIMTTTENIESLKAGISLESFPKTFQDAIFVTRELRCRYIWIDSLCIIQDSAEDWKREASRMADVYGNSYVTIAAVAARNSYGGLFNRHDMLDARHTIERTNKSGQTIAVNVRPALEHSPYFASTPYGLEPSVSAPLLERSWCFQEYLLAPRVLSFTKWEMLWVCLSKRSCNCGEYSEAMREVVSSSDLKARFDAQIREPSLKELRRLWDDIVEAYLRKGLTYDTDRLPALAGIAHLFSERGLGRYLNGIWEPTLLPGLFWEADQVFGAQYDIAAKRSIDQRIPSWSWASVSGAFRYSPSMGAIEGLEIVDISYGETVPGSLAEPSAMGINIRGILSRTHAWATTSFENKPTNHHRLIQVSDGETQPWYIDIVSELTCSADSPAEVYLLRGIRGPGLVLRRIEGTASTYRRLGMMDGSPSLPSKHDYTAIQLV